MYFRKNESRRAFTLIELLVVIGIIGTLIAVLLPALSKAKHVAKLTSCATNVKNLGTAFAAYLADNRQFYPATGRFTAGAQAAPYWADFVGSNGTMAPYNDNEPRLLNHYMAEYSTSVRCPLDTGISDIASPDPVWRLAGTSYSYPDRAPSDVFNNIRRTIYGIWIIEGHKEQSVRQPSLKLIIADPIIMDPTNRPATDSKNWWHNTADQLNASVLFGDGHVSNTPRKTLTNQNTNNLTTDETLLSTNEYY